MQKELIISAKMICKKMLKSNFLKKIYVKITTDKKIEHTIQLKLNCYKKELIAEGRDKEKSSIPLAAYTDYRHVQLFIHG